ncbi:hypothetical protein Halru_3062 [Halovivax ruber XH-70]|uniref:Transcriptional regulator n=1 Tax=Halovivax ruber (strain DSM 18193 / JCM 13892 / XH-70) TaxID=797302 RepID=L0IFK5_HALRX|nr:winged helix-turn-helix transcriptional regulator [Halovivax ruber]AGB17628.1 hypothetical protein Halru_3062 [Halovivax ruber XH-70]
MKLRQPTDFLILEALKETGRNVAPNLASHTGKSRKNINTRLPVLEDYSLVRKVGPAERSGLYEVTPLGKTALMHQDEYDDVDDFEALIQGSSPATDGGEAAQAVARSSNQAEE